jgi:hypothetical protein
MTASDNAYVATGIGTNADFMASPGKVSQPPAWGFVTAASEARFTIGGSFSGVYCGVQGFGGYPDDSGKVGPNLNQYSQFAGVQGLGVDVTGVAGASVNLVGVYGQVGEEDPKVQMVVGSAGVFGKANVDPGVRGWSSNGTGIEGIAFKGPGVDGSSFESAGVQAYSDSFWGVRAYSRSNNGVVGTSIDQGPPLPTQYVQQAGVFGTSRTKHGVVGTSEGQVGVFGYSRNSQGIYGMTNNPAAYAGVFVGNVVCFGTLTASTKNALVPFPDGSQRVLHCMESPEHWFEDFGSAKLARGRAVVKLDADFAKIIKRGGYRVFPAPEGDCRGLYVRRKNAMSFEVRELMGGKSSITFSYRIVGRRKDIKEHRRFAKIDTRRLLPTPAARAPRKPTAAGRRAFLARVEKEVRAQARRTR